MGLLNIISNEVKAAIGYQQNFADLLTAKDVTRALSMMKAHAEEAANNLREYKIDTHKVMERKDRAVYDKKGNFLRWSKRWKIPIPYPQFINEISLVFLYGRPMCLAIHSGASLCLFSLFWLSLILSQAQE